MSYAGSPLTRIEWLRAIDAQASELAAEMTGASIALSQPCAEFSTTLEHLMRMAAVDKAYAWWSAHLYAKLDPRLADMPARLAEVMKAEDDHTPETAQDDLHDPGGQAGAGAHPVGAGRARHDHRRDR